MNMYEEYYDEEYAMSARRIRSIVTTDTSIQLNCLTDNSALSCCVLDSGAHRPIFNNEIWLEGTNSTHLTPTSTPINGISGSIMATDPCVIGRQATFIYPSAKDNVLSLGRPSQFPTILTTFSCVNNSFRISFGVHIFEVPMTSDFLYYISKEQAKTILIHVNSVTNNVSNAY